MIRIMKPEDYDAVYGLWLSCAGMGLNDLDDSRQGIERYLRRNPDTCFVALEQGKLVGAILSGHDGRRGFIYHTSVHPEFQSRGIGSALVQAALNALEQAGIHKVAWWSSPKTKPEMPSGSVRAFPFGRICTIATGPCAGWYALTRNVTV